MSTIKSSAEDLTLNADGSNDVKFQINAVEKASINSSGLFTSTTIDATALTGNLPAISGASLTGLPAAGDKRNFIIDGDFTQWPIGTTATTLADSTYGPALWHGTSSNDGTVTWERSTDVPTVAAASHESEYSLLLKCTGTDASIGAAQFQGLRYNITGSDFSSLHQQACTLSFWAKTSSQNSGHNYNIALWNNGADRTFTQTFSPTSTWTKFTVNITMDSSGTWTFTEATVGLMINFMLAAGTDWDDGTEGSWVGTQEGWASSGTAISNFLDHTSNELYISQVQLTLGSTAPTFTSPPIATVRDQVRYYVEMINEGGDASVRFAIGGLRSTTSLNCLLTFAPKRINAVTVTNKSGTASHYGGMNHVDSNGTGTGLPGYGNINGLNGTTNVNQTINSVGSAGQPCFFRAFDATAKILIDARH